MPTLDQLRDAFHADLIQNLWGQRPMPNVSPQTPWFKSVAGSSRAVFNMADGHNDVSVLMCEGVCNRVGVPSGTLSSGQGSTSGKAFERATSAFITDALDLFSHLSAKQFIVTPPAQYFATPAANGKNRRLPRRIIGSYAQFEHLVEIERLVKDNPDLQAALGGDYQVDPDIFVIYEPFTDADLNSNGANLDADTASRTFMRHANRAKPKPILHASISCKWTMRRDRAQNIRLEALNMVRNRKGRLPHITAVTMECDPGILGSLSLGTGDIDCVYHGALVELIDTAEDAAQTHGGQWEGYRDHLRRMVDGSRLRDIADLPLDLLT